MNRTASEPRRRSPGFRRLLFAGVALALLPTPLTGNASTLSSPTVQDEEAPRLIAREIRLTRSPAGDYRILEILDLDPGTRRGGPLALVRLPDLASRFAAAGSEVEPTDLLLESSTVSILRWPPGLDLVQVLISYQLPARMDAVQFVSPLETDQFGISLARGSVQAKLDRRLEPAGTVGSAASPRRRFVTSELEPGTAVAIGLGSTRVGWRERLAVLLAATLAGALGAVWVWRN